jgi:hypothetical protein
MLQVTFFKSKFNKSRKTKEGNHLGTIQMSYVYLCETLLVTLIRLQSLHSSPLNNATISNMKSDNCKALQKELKTIAL